jgi:hypothetical protein
MSNKPIGTFFASVKGKKTIAAKIFVAVIASEIVGYIKVQLITCKEKPHIDCKGHTHR